LCTIDLLALLPVPTEFGFHTHVEVILMERIQRQTQCSQNYFTIHCLQLVTEKQDFSQCRKTHTEELKQKKPEGSETLAYEKMRRGKKCLGVDEKWKVSFTE